MLVASALAAAAFGAMPAAHAAKLDKVTIGYSAWPGWFPLAVADKAGIFEKNGLDVDLKYFADYIASLDAMTAGKLDANTQTLNDTMAAVAGGSKQSIIVVNDNSAGNDAIICDDSITSVADMKGKTVAAEQGVVDHFLLLQGLAKAGMTESDIDFRGVLTADAASSFSGGEFDCVGVFAPFTLEALKRPGSHVVFSSKDFPGTIPDHIVVSKDMVAKQPKVAQKLVNAWYDTLDYMAANPDESTKIMADAAEISTADYADLAGGTKIFTVDDALAAFQPGSDTTSLEYTAKLINPFLVKSGLTKKQASLKGLFAPQFTQAYADAQGSAS
ncbi:MAG TPA: ABC transporter substrate-binding protein [Acidimicrobiia bacterium]|nr:ABC transporter substrate-binding protein [Acidimicrobiia bacterium]